MEDGNGKSVDRRFWEEAFGAGRPRVVDELVASGCTLEDPVVYPYAGPEGIKEFVGAIHKVFPNTDIDIHEQLAAEGNRIVSRWRFAGSSRDQKDAPAEIIIRGMSTTRVEDEKIQSIHTRLVIDFETTEEGISSWWCRIVRCK